MVKARIKAVLLKMSIELHPPAHQRRDEVDDADQPQQQEDGHQAVPAVPARHLVTSVEYDDCEEENTCDSWFCDF